MEHTQSGHEKKGLFYTYLGEGGSAAVAFIYFLFLLFCIYGFLRWG
jgi:hypothetical protein